MLIRELEWRIFGAKETQEKCISAVEILTPYCNNTCNQLSQEVLSKLESAIVSIWANLASEISQSLTIDKDHFEPSYIIKKYRDNGAHGFVKILKKHQISVDLVLSCTSKLQGAALQTELSARETLDQTSQSGGISTV